VILILWLNEHRILVVSLLAASMWVGAYGWYFRNPIRFWITRGKPHNWSVDMVTKKAVARGQEQI
jgi:hypothetical protein